jgi:hypothetical protein
MAQCDLHFAPALPKGVPESDWAADDYRVKVAFNYFVKA